MISNLEHQLFQAQSSDGQSKVRKRKSKGLGSSQTPDLNLPVIDTTALIPTSLVANHVSQMAKQGEDASGHDSAELSKKQRHFSNQSRVGSAAVADGSPCRAQ